VSGFVAPAFPNKKKPELEVLQEVEEEVVENLTTSKKKDHDMLFGPT
jgi:hypothetical protein